MTETSPRRHRWTRTLGLVAALFVIMVVPPGAQTRQMAVQVTGAVGGDDVEQLDLLVGRSAVLRLDRPITRVSLSTPDIADALVTSPYEVLIHGKTPGTISLLIWGDTGSIRTYDVAVRRDLGVLEQRLRELFPSETIRVASNGTDVVLSGIVSTKYVVDKAAAVAVGYVEKPENVVNLLQQQEGVATNQVLLRVRFAEVSRTAMQELGASFFTGLFGHEDWIARVTTQQFPAPEFDSEKGLVFSDFLNLLAFQTEEQLGAVVKALQTRGLFQSLAEPNLVTQNGREASFLAGGEYPYPVLQGSGVAGAVTIFFKEFGVRLRFTPTVVGDDLIHLKVAPEVSALDFSNAVTIEGFRVPALSTRRTETEVELRDGQTFAISGLIDNTVTETMSKIPGIGDIPILGYLFRSRAYQKNATELVVMITPHIVRRDEPGVTPNLPNLMQPYLPPPERTLPPPPPAFIGPQSRVSTGPPAVAAESTTPAVTAATVAPAVTADGAADGAPAPVREAAAPAASVEPPSQASAEWPAVSAVEPLAASPAEPEASSHVDTPAVSPVERPGVSDVERPLTKDEREAIERARNEDARRLEEARQHAEEIRKLGDEQAREAAKLEARRVEEERLRAEETRKVEDERAREAAKLEQKRLEDERKQAAQARKEEETRLAEERKLAAERAREQAEVDRKRFEEEQKQAERDRKEAEKLAKADAKRQAESARRAAKADRERLEEERKLAEEKRKAEEKLAQEAAKREAEIEKILAEHRKEIEEVQRKLGVEQLDAGTRLVIPMNEPQGR